MYTVYKIIHNDKIIYYGRTNNLKRREWEHNYYFKKDMKKELYKYLRMKKIDNIKLIPIRTFKKKVDSKRFEAYLILHNYFNTFTLFQKIPSITDR